jgi:hypothetical protein
VREQSREDWEDAARWMCLLVDLWQLAKNKDRGGLSRHIRWIEGASENKCVIYECRRGDYPKAHLPKNGSYEIIASNDE